MSHAKEESARRAARRRTGVPSRTAERSSRLGFVYVGGRVPVYDRDGSRSGIAVESRVRVQGHWKSQTHGKAMSLRKITHIEPYWRGPDMAEAVNKPYSVR